MIIIQTRVRRNIMEVVKLSNLLGTTICGIYKLNFPNGKCYIGQSQNIYKRVSEHNQRARTGRPDRDIQICDSAIKKYGQISYFEILEECSLDQLDQREKYWINYYQALDKERGYNLLDRGTVAGRRGSDNPNAKISNDQWHEIKDLLSKHPELSYKEIGKRYGVNKGTISSLNQGLSYYHENTQYPIREKFTQPKRSLNWKTYFNSIEELVQLKYDLKNRWDMTESDLSLLYPKCSMQCIHKINQGKLFADIGPEFTYPIRPKGQQKIASRETILEILNLLHNTNTPMAEIGHMYSLARGTISNINQGKKCPIENYDYPARKTFKRSK